MREKEKERKREERGREIETGIIDFFLTIDKQSERPRTPVRLNSRSEERRMN